jgi:hypothetical protein
MAGCQPKAAPAPVAVVGDAITRATAHVQSADRHVRSAQEHSNFNGKVLLKVASDELASALVDHVDASAGLVEARKLIDRQAVEIATGRQAYAKLEGKWYVEWGRWIERVLMWLVIAWVGAGVVAVAMGIPVLPLAQRISVELVRLAPAMNPFSWIRNYIRGKQGKPAL